MSARPTAGRPTTGRSGWARQRTRGDVLVRAHQPRPQTLTSVGNSGSTPTGTCEPGAGCGIAADDFTARRTGTEQILAHRNSCGEAMRCGAGQGSYAVTVYII
ncbi:hypothetical protein [Streptomyces sp. WM6378]|uniref:hypothetical protein n=1 Tax=Streptomyces sp. WM6378 TaxID=1415557 RepID=UPI0006B028D9|nr:hypothetical protein [Streptomyces sp. WM6378]KOU35372.1 hypothetical protein ADK54_37730 [Streptomyces sp. WM6378]